MRTVISYYNFRGTNKLIMLIIDDSLANLIRANNLSLTYNVADITEARNKIAQVLGTEDMLNTAYPFPYKAGIDVGDFANDLPLFLPNAFIVTDTPGTNLDCEVGNIELYSTLYTSSSDALGEANKSIGTGTFAGKTPYYLCGQGSFSGTSGNYYYMSCSFFVFKESEYNDGNFVFTDTTSQTPTVCQIKYFRPSASATSQHRLEINVRGNNTADLSARLIFNNFKPPSPPAPSSDDPYDPTGDGSGYSGTGGGPAPTGGTGTTGTGGLHDDTSDAIPTPNTPSDVVVSSGIFTAYNPSASQLASFASALWNMQPTDINDVLRFLFGGDAFNAIIGMHLLPVAPSVSGTQSIKLGNWDTGVSAPKISSQYAQVSFGSVLLPEYWGNCIDYAPYTRVQLALPYIGMVDVDTDDVLGSTNTLTYNIDVLSGALCAMLHCVKGNLTSVIYQWSGSCAVDLPITGANKNAIIGAIGASGVVTSMAFSAAGGGLLGGLAASAALAGSAASAYGTAKGKVQKNGNFGSHAGALGIMTPYFIVSRPVQSVPTSWQADKGYPANISAQLGTVLGYTEVSEINLECSGTEAEKKEIIDLLKKGVLF